MKLVLLDLDGTLINADYRLTVPENEFRATIQKLTSKDICVGLCSDSAVITLRQWSELLGLTGPIIAERGAVVSNLIRQTENILDISATAWFSDFRELFVNAVMKNFPGATLIIGDATRFVKDSPVNAALTQQVFAINGFRVASFSFFACHPKNDRSAMEPDFKLFKRASALATEIIAIQGKNKEDLFWDENFQHGILIVHAGGTEKWRGVSVVIDQFAPEQIVMIGDGMSDFLDLPNVKQYAVSNSDSSYKARSIFVANHSFTQGVIECLQHFAR